MGSVPVLGGPLGPSEHLHRFFTSVQELERPALDFRESSKAGGLKPCSSALVLSKLVLSDQPQW